MLYINTLEILSFSIKIVRKSQKKYPDAGIGVFFI